MTIEKLSYTVAEACAATGTSRSQLYVLLKDGAIPSIMMAGRRLILRKDLEEYMQSLRTQQWGAK